jgi:hypothetical protein
MLSWFWKQYFSHNKDWAKGWTIEESRFHCWLGQDHHSTLCIPLKNSLSIHTTSTDENVAYSISTVEKETPLIPPNTIKLLTILNDINIIILTTNLM